MIFEYTIWLNLNFSCGCVHLILDITSYLKFSNAFIQSALQMREHLMCNNDYFCYYNHIFTLLQLHVVKLWYFCWFLSKLASLCLVSMGKTDTCTYGNQCVCMYLHALITIKPTDRCIMWPSRTFTVLRSPRKRADQSARCFHPNTSFLDVELAPPPNLSCNSSALFRSFLMGWNKSVFVRPVYLPHFLLVLSLALAAAPLCHSGDVESPGDYVKKHT